MTDRQSDATRDYYDRLGDAEWDRLAADIPGRVSAEVHRRFLSRYVRPGDRVLEVGAGPGRFTLALAGLGARVVVTDLSPVQLDLNRRRVQEAGAEHAVERRELVDVRDTTRYADGEFDLVLAYGGPLSYVFEDATDALRGLLRVAGDGVVLASVMSALGTWRHALPGVVAAATAAGEEANDAVVTTGDLRAMPGHPHACQMYRAAQVTDLVAAAGGGLLAASASNWASLGDPSALAVLESDPDRWARFLDHEVAACAEPGALDGGAHLLFAAARTP